MQARDPQQMEMAFLKQTYSPDLYHKPMGITKQATLKGNSYDAGLWLYCYMYKYSLEQNCYARTMTCSLAKQAHLPTYPTTMPHKQTNSMV
jgi:hypothetical protein